MDKKDYVIFGTKTLSDLFKDIYKKAEAKDVQIHTLINELSRYVNNANSATLIVPLIAQYLEVGVRNNEQLVKLAEIVQRLLKAEKNEDSADAGLLTDEERKKLYEEAIGYTERLRAKIKKEAQDVVKINRDKEKKLKELNDGVQNR